MKLPSDGDSDSFRNTGMPRLSASLVVITSSANVLFWRAGLDSTFPPAAREPGDGDQVSRKDRDVGIELVTRCTVSFIFLAVTTRW